MGDYTPSTVANDVTMQGSGVYSSHSDLQHEVMLQALPLIEKAAKTLESQRAGQVLTVAEYGAAQGANSIKPLETITKSIPPETLQIILNDKANNDFNTLSTTITNWTQNLTKPPFITMIPGSFYNQILPPNTIDLGFSLASIQHLSATRPMMDENLQRIPNADQILQEQSHKDFLQFLHHRAIETNPGGSLVLSFPSKSASGASDLVGPVTSIFGALKMMFIEGKVSKGVLSSLNEPLYNRSMEDVLSTLSEVEELWTMRECFENQVVHPAYGELQRVKSEEGLVDDEAAWKYTHAIIDWVTAVISGYLLKALRDGDPENYSEEKGGELVSEWISRTKGFYFAHFRGEEVSMSFIHVWLQRR
ncbi:uncharacterized protein N7496_007945 [Penicillium cataractarum]|uniref:Uncharacterized protein n=1 Tax=Penicillium cataractarum TaxID=2100454 RepID=A0A9W9V6G6_9EURO|nr:uncharacterized protein N7496_007945 [Penicillium cataractarum]KAJ5368185.1 hypothetical protein N7496_007945 [Penicillium cataractarum]